MSASNVAKLRADLDYEERRLSGREWYGVPLNAPVAAGATTTFADYILHVAATQEWDVSTSQVEAALINVLPPADLAILNRVLAGETKAAVAKDLGLSWKQVDGVFGRAVRQVRRRLGLEPMKKRVGLSLRELRANAAARTRRFYRKNVALGLCRCGKEREAGHLTCRPCRDRRNQARRELRAKGLCRDCHKPSGGQFRCDDCRKYARELAVAGTPEQIRAMRLGEGRGEAQSIAVKLPRDLYDAIHVACKERGVTLSNLVRAAIRRHLEYGRST